MAQAAVGSRTPAVDVAVCVNRRRVRLTNSNPPHHCSWIHLRLRRHQRGSVKHALLPMQDMRGVEAGALTQASIAAMAPGVDYPGPGQCHGVLRGSCHHGARPADEHTYLCRHPAVICRACAQVPVAALAPDEDSTLLCESQGVVHATRHADDLQRSLALHALEAQSHRDRQAPLWVRRSIQDLIDKLPSLLRRQEVLLRVAAPVEKRFALFHTLGPRDSHAAASAEAAN
mmetsp:Transcript_77307/g.165763  ORF Transcript_77307/g.165763 Transcript_77307/m.165763 type:complete len:230 (-) Transcript_77307:463-1152(-)